MIAHNVAQMLSNMGVTKSHSRPKTSNGNPYSESQYKTLKYRHDFPDRFGCIEDTRTWCTGFFDWYNLTHRHSGIAMHAPFDVHFGLADQLREMRADVLASVYQQHPERFVRRPPEPRSCPRLPGPTSRPTADTTIKRSRPSNRSNYLPLITLTGSAGLRCVARSEVSRELRTAQRSTSPLPLVGRLRRMTLSCSSWPGSLDPVVHPVRFRHRQWSLRWRTSRQGRKFANVSSHFMGVAFPNLQDGSLIYHLFFEGFDRCGKPCRENAAVRYRLPEIEAVIRAPLFGATTRLNCRPCPDGLLNFGDWCSDLKGGS